MASKKLKTAIKKLKWQIEKGETEAMSLQELLDQNLIHSFCVVRYEFEGESLNARITIRAIKALDENGKYLKFVSLREVLPILHRFPVAWKEKLC
jgi:hypothetical protein